MEVSTVTTPRFILRSENQPICPTVAGQSEQGSLTSEANVVFAFSDKPEYDLFLNAGSVPLTPYPLVKRFLSEKLEANPGTLHLVVMDAADSEQPILYAATFESVLDSLLQSSDSVAVTHQLIRQPSSGSYKIQATADSV